MSGVEVAGLVLGALPLSSAGLQFYAEGIAVTKILEVSRAFVKQKDGLRICPTHVPPKDDPTECTAAGSPISET